MEQEREQMTASEADALAAAEHRSPDEQAQLREYMDYRRQQVEHLEASELKARRALSDATRANDSLKVQNVASTQRAIAAEVAANAATEMYKSLLATHERTILAAVNVNKPTQPGTVTVEGIVYSKGGGPY